MMIARAFEDIGTSQELAPPQGRITEQLQGGINPALSLPPHPFTVPHTEAQAFLLSRMRLSGGLVVSQSLLSLQRRFGNRYVQRAMALAKSAEEEQEVPAHIESAIERQRGGGQHLPEKTRIQMESAFGANFTGVRIHTGAEANALNHAVNAVAFTTGSDIFFSSGSYEPDSSGGKELLAHELTHVVQQRGESSGQTLYFSIQRLCPECEKKRNIQLRLNLGGISDPAELEADRVAKAVAGKIARGSSGKDAHPIGQPHDLHGACSCATASAGTQCEHCRGTRDESRGSKTPSDLVFKGFGLSIHVGRKYPGNTQSAKAQDEGDDQSDQGTQGDQDNAADENDEIVVVAQAGSTPDGNTLGPTDPSKRCCLGPTRLIWTGGPGQNTATAATGRSRVTAHLGSAPADGADCDCSCGLFRQFIRGFIRTGSPTAAKTFDIGSCGTIVTMSEAAWTEEFEACNPGGPPVSAACDRVYLDEPGFSAGLTDGHFVQLHLVLRYQMWDQCRGHEVATGDRTLDIRGDRAPRSISFG